MTQRTVNFSWISLVALLPGGLAHPHTSHAAETNTSPGGGVAQESASEGRTYTIENPYFKRVINVTYGRLSTKEMGMPHAPVAINGRGEFAVILGPDKKRITSDDFEGELVVNKAKGLLGFTLQQRTGGLKARVEYRLGKDDFFLRNFIEFKNEGTAPIQILDVEVESIQFADAKALGVGKPVYAEKKLFLGLEYPLGRNEEKNGLVTLRHLPGKTLQPGEILISKTAVVGAAAKNETVEQAFDRYIRRIALRQPEVMTVYGNWARYDYLSDGIRPDEKIVLETVEELAKMRKAGWRPDYYVMDAGWFDTKGDYTDYIKPAWPDGPARMVEAIRAIGMKYGLWFEVGGGIPENPAVQPSKTHDGRLCMAPGPYLSAFKKGLVRQIEDLGLTMIKFDFATFNCNSDKHGHLPEEYGTEASLSGFLDMIDDVRGEHPHIKYIIFNGFYRSPWWLMHVDTIYSNDPAPWDFPSLRLRDSINLKTDKSVHEHHFNHLLPWYTIDDCGLMIGRTGTIYWIGAEEFRKTWVLNIGRGNMMPFIYGDLRLLDESDRQFVARMWRTLMDNADVFADTRLIGKANGNEVYGYSHVKGEHGFVFLNNSTFECKDFVLRLDPSIGFSASAKSPLRVSELFPVECTYADEDHADFKPGAEVRLNLAPFEVRALVIKPPTGVTSKAVPPRPAAYKSIPISVQLEVKEPEWVNDVLLERLNKEQTHLASSTTAKLERSEGITRSRVKGAYSFSVQLPTTDKPWTLALPMRFMANHNPVRNNRPTSCALAAVGSPGTELEFAL